jgi:3-isopropylmalate dehydrogenase
MPMTDAERKTWHDTALTLHDMQRMATQAANTVNTLATHLAAADNLFGDIVTDLAAAVTGGIGLAASGNINPDRTAPSMFEPVHGSAPDIAGQGKADPTAAVLSGAMLLEHLGLTDVAEAVRRAVAADLAERAEQHPAGRTTAQIGDAIAARVGA